MVSLMSIRISSCTRFESQKSPCYFLLLLVFPFFHFFVIFLFLSPFSYVTDKFFFFTPSFFHSIWQTLVLFLFHLISVLLLLRPIQCVSMTFTYFFVLLFLDRSLPPPPRLSLTPIIYFFLNYFFYDPFISSLLPLRPSCWLFPLLIPLCKSIYLPASCFPILFNYSRFSSFLLPLTDSSFFPSSSSYSF